MFDILNNIYTARNSAWIDELSDSEISPLILNRFLSMNDKIIKHVSYLNAYTFDLAPKNWLHLAWCLIPKYSQAPFFKYMKAKKDEDPLNPVWKKIQKVLNSSENDMIYVKKYLLPEIESDKVQWFKMMGMDKKVWQDNGLDFEDIRGTTGTTKGASGLELFGM